MKYIKLFENFEQDDLTREIEDYLGVDLETFGEVQRLMGLSPEGLNRWVESELDKDEPNLKVIAELERLGYAIKLPKEEYLFYAAKHDMVELALDLLDKGADIEANDDLYKTPLHYAAANDSIRVATLLLDRGAYIEARNWDKDTPLHWAAYNDSIRVATLLLDRGANMKAKNQYEETPLDWASGGDSPQVANLFRKHRATE